MSDYYNEHDPFAAAWLRELIAAGEIPAGDVDERSIEDVVPSDLVGYRRCHFFAGIGGWALAMRLADWPDDVPLWTGSCPCQPFSAAGQGAGFADERHLWPAFHWLIRQCQPRYVCGEQVASTDALRWWDLVATDLEGAGYACTAVDLPAASVGAPHKRSRLFWVADATTGRHDGWWAGQAGNESRTVERPERFRDVGVSLAHPSGAGSAEQRWRRDESARLTTASGTDAWADCIWLHCTDGKARPVESASVWMADGLSDHLGLVRLASHPDRPHEERLIYAPLIQKGKARVGRLRGYGNAIVPQAAAEVLRAWQAVMR